MRRKLLLLCLLICSIMGLWACGSDPYQNLSLTVYCNDQVVAEDAVINLNIKQEAEGIYNYEQVVLLVKVDDDDEATDRGVTISDGQGFVNTTTQFDPRSGITSIIVKANSYANTGNFSLKISTNEGNKERLVNFNIDLALENFTFKEDSLKVIGKGNSLSLKNVDDYIEFYPAATTQRDIKVELATLSPAGSGEGLTHFVDGWLDGGNFSYANDGKHYASIINGVLNTYDKYDNGTGTMVKVAYPTQTISASMGADTLQQEVVVLKASFYLEAEKEYIERFKVIPVIEACEEIEVSMNAQQGEVEEFVLPLSEMGYYELVLIDPSFRESIFTANLEYYIERELNFHLSENFHVEAEPTGESLPVNLVPITGENHFKVHAMKSGIYKHEFRIVHDDYPDLFDQRVVVEFTVKDLPTDILINGKESVGAFTIYDYYANSKGERIDVDLNTKVGKYEYFVFTREYAGILSVNLNTARSTENLVFANYISDRYLLTTTVEGKNYTKFGPTDSFYLSHSFDVLPNVILPLYIGVSINLCADSYYESYTDTEINSYFMNLLMNRSFYVQFQMGLREFEFEGENFHIDLTNEKYMTGGRPADAIPLCVLPEGQTLDSCLAKLEYDSSLINITEYTPAERNARTVVVAQCNNIRKEGTTAVRFLARNGVEGNITVSTYMPTIYTLHTEGSPVPLAISVNEKSSGYLYRVSGNSTKEDYASHFDKLPMVGTSGVLGTYDSASILFGIVGNKIEIAFKDFTYIGGIFSSYDITSKVRVSFNNDGYVTYSNGVLSLHRLVPDIDMPIIMTLKYVGGYEVLDENNKPEYKEVTVEHKVSIYVYSPLQGISILSEKSADLYVYDSLSYFDRTATGTTNANTRDLSSNTIKASFSPSESSLGSAWNENFGGYKPLTLVYSCEMLDEAVKDKNGKAVVIQSNSAGNDYPLYYRDIFQVDPARDETLIYTCQVRSKLSRELIEWIANNYGGNAPINYKIQSFLDNYILDRDYSIVVNIFAGQFGRLSNINTITYTCCYASKINSLKLNVDDDGVYFDVRDGKQQSVIEYTIDNAQCLNKEMIIVGGTTNHFTTKIEYGSGNTGKITIDTIDNMVTGEIYSLTIIPKDNVSDYTVADGYTFYTDSLNQTIRIKIADGSKALPFEIKSALDFKDMINDIEIANNALPTDSTTKYYHYVLARDISLYGENLEIVDIVNQNRGNFSLSGKHTFSRNNEEITTYNRIYNLSINRTLSTLDDHMYFGLFGTIGKNVSIENLSVLNVKFMFETSQKIENAASIYVGAIAGKLAGATLQSVSVSGSIKTQLDAPNVSLYIGGMVGIDDATAGGVIKNKPESAIAGMASTSNNSTIEIELNGAIKEQNVGGIAGKLSATNIQILQVVSQIKSKSTADIENIGGVVGQYSANGKTINGLQVSPVIVIESRSSKLGNIGGIVGDFTAGTINNSKIYFTNLGDDYSQKEKISIYVLGLEKANVGGLVGRTSGSTGTRTLKYSYVRSFYNTDIKMGKYAGNVFVTSCQAATVGGIIGLVDTATQVQSSYFDADIMVDAIYEELKTADDHISDYYYPAAAGLMFGEIKAGTVDNSYGIGKLYYNLSSTITDETMDPVSVTKTNTFVAANTISNRDGIIGNTIYDGKDASILHKEYDSAITAATFNKVYAVVNDLTHYFAENQTIVTVESMQKLIDDGAAVDTLSLFKNLGYVLTTGEQDGTLTALDFNWFYNEKINLSAGHAYPILLSASGLAMYDLVPTSIGIIVNDENKNVFNISYTDDMAVRHNQMIMFVKKTTQGVYSNDYYEIMVDRSAGSENATIKVTFNGESIDTYLVDIAIDDQIEIFLKTNNSVLELVNNRIYPRNEGEATIEIRSYLDKTIKTTITVKVIASVDTIKMFEIVDTNKVELEDENYGVSSNRSVVYIDEASNFEISACDSEGYKSTKEIGYILELLSYTETINAGTPEEEEIEINGSVTIDGVTYEYKEGENNTYFLDGDSILKATGVTIGYVKFKLTPYLKLGDIYHADKYVCANGVEIQFQNADKTGKNVYILNKGDLDIANIYVLSIKARAIDVDNSTKVAGISSMKHFDFVATIETTNVVETIVSGKSVYSLLEDVYIDMGLVGSKIDYKNLKVVDLEGITWVEENKGDTYYFGYEKEVSPGNTEFILKPYVFEYDLITLQVNSFTIMKTNVNVETREHTYKISLNMHVSFDKEFYRANANKYDLNIVKFNVNVIPYSNLLLDAMNDYAPYGLKNSAVMDTTEVNIIPASLTDIFMNYYTRGEGLLGNTENTYPSDNESNFIVPGRDGLLKITLAEEFNNSSYVTITLDKKYAGYVKLEQMAGVIITSGSGESTSTEFETYQELDYVDPVETPDYYGLRLQKLTSNSSTTTYFNNTYYVKVTLAEASDYSDFISENPAYDFNPIVEIKATSYTIDAKGNVKETLAEPKVKVLTIAELPSIIAQVDGESVFYMGMGVKKEINIRYKGLTNDVMISSSNDYLYVVDESDEKVATLDIDYLDRGGKYYLCLAVDAYYDADEKYRTELSTVTFTGEEYVWGVLETTKSELWVNPVEFEITNVRLQDTMLNEETGEYEMTINHGQSVILRLDFEYADIEVAIDDENIAKHKAMLDTYYRNGAVGEQFSPKQLVEYAIAGTTVTRTQNGIQEYLSRGILQLSKITYSGKEEIQTPVNEFGKVYGGIELLNDSFISSYDNDTTDPIVEIFFTLIRGVSISSDGLLRMSVPYHYDNGKVIAGPNSNGIYYDDYIEFRVIVKDNSSDTHPTPIENELDLKNYAGTTGHYILVNHITLTGWAPIPLSVDSLDGNGYSIIIKSFDMESVRATNDANGTNAGIFTTIAENTLVKNLIIDVSHILTDETTILNNTNIVNNSTADKFVHDPDGAIDLTFVSALNFGLLAGTNNGAITNIKVVNTKGLNKQEESQNKYLHILTSQIDKDGNATNSNIGGLVGINSVTGAISNSFLGINISNEKDVALAGGGTEHRSYITIVENPDDTQYHNRYDEMRDIQVYPFVIAGSNNIAGATATNNGIISNSYAKGLGIYNTYSAVSNSITAGLVGVNNNIITSCFVEGTNIHNYRATGKYVGDDDYKDTIEAVGNVGGLVFTNNKTIENSYANVYLETQSAFIAGFVFTNNGTVSNSYSTSVNRNNLAYGQFTGVLQRVVQNFGTYENCYYLVGDGESENEKEVAVPILIAQFTESKTATLSDFWSGFSFTAQSGANEEDGIWTIRDGLPKVATTLTDTNSFRILDQIEEISNDDGIIEYLRYSYIYGVKYQEGTKGNPLIIENAKNFDIKIIDRGRALGNDKYIFGAADSKDILGKISAVEYVRLVNNLDFSSITTSNMINGRYLYQTIFAGKLDGNGMSMNNLHIDTDTTQLSDFGIFKQVGYDATESSSQTVIKNVNMSLSSYKSNNNSRAGVLAGTIKNATIANVKINGNGVAISATNMAGALAGLIVADKQNKVSIMDVVVENITVSAEYSSIGGEIDGYTTDESNGRYKRFNILNRENNEREKKSFNSLNYVVGADGQAVINNTGSVSYAGTIAGVLIANNLDTFEKTSNNIADYRSTTTACSIDNIVVRNNITIKTADNAGGLFGYISENTRIKNSKFELSSGTQLIKSWNYAGGIVGENHGIIDQCFVAYADAEQEELDATILPEATRDNGTVNLFSMSDGNFYNVAVGGIAGYSSGGAIIDSYSKASVIQPLAFIAGGIVGYAEGDNFIGYTYTTGAVYARAIMGGIVGLQVTHDEDYYNSGTEFANDINVSQEDKILHLNTVVALNDWDTYRDNISKILYNNYKSLYYSGEGYNDFQLKLPEIGNQDIDLGLERDTDGSYHLDIANKERLYTISAETLDKYNVNLDKVKAEVFKVYDGENKTADIDENEDGTVSAVERDKWIALQLISERLIESATYTEDDYKKGLELYYVIHHVYDIPTDYRSSHTKMFAGSVIGASYVYYKSHEGTGNDVVLTIRNQGFINKKDTNILYSADNTANTFSTTFGIYSIEGNGTLENGDRSDTYYKETFDLAIGVNDKVTLHSYKISYLDSDISFNNVELNFMDDSIYMDKISFNKVFTAQEYTEQMIGSFYRTEEGWTSYKKTYNIFKAHNTDDGVDGEGRYNTAPGPGTEVFIENTLEPVWEIENILPKMNDGKFITVEYFYAGCNTPGSILSEEDTEKLEAVFKSNANDRTYYLVPGTAEEYGKYTTDNSYDDSTDYTFEIPINDDNVNIKYMATVRSVFIGETVVTPEGKSLRPTIKFVVNSNDVGSVFSFISGANFSNIDIVVEIADVPNDNTLQRAKRDYSDYGILANTVENVTFDNCSITVNFLHNNVPTLDSDVYFAINNGFLFGSVSNSTIKNSTLSVIIGANAVSLNNSKIENFGFVAGSMYRTKFENNSIMVRGNTINDAVTLQINKVADTSNIGGVIGILNNSTYTNNTILNAATLVNENPDVYYPQSLVVEDKYNNDTKEMKDGVEVYSHTLTKNISSLIGYGYNSTVKITTVSGGKETMKLHYKKENSSEVAKDIVNLSVIAGASQNSKYIGIELSDFENSNTTNSLIYVKADVAKLAKLSAGVIIGNDINSSQVGELINDSIIGNASSITVLSNADIVAVGGLVGNADKSTKLYNAYNTADIKVTNIKKGKKEQQYDKDTGAALLDGKGNPIYKYEYVNTYVGGLVGSASGKVMMDSVLSSGVINIGKTETDDTVGFAMGGLIGYTTSSSELNRFTVLNDFDFDDTFTTLLYNSYVSGVVGFNKGSLSVKNGYTYCEFLFDFTSATSKFNKVLVSTITNSKIIYQENVFYAQELIGNNYLTDSKFSSYAMADLYGTISKYSPIAAIDMKSTLDNLNVVDDKNSTPVATNMKLPVADSLRLVAVSVMSKYKAGNISSGDGYSRFNVYEINSTNSQASYNPVPFKVINESVTLTSIYTLERYHYISGRSVEKGKVVVSLNYSESSSDVGYMVAMNQGVISNIYMSTAKDDGNGNMLALNVVMTVVNDVSGLITNVYVYERTTCQSGISMGNYGKIYQSATATIYLGDELEIFAIARMNCGEINDCYSASVGYTENNSKTTDVYMVEDNEHGVTASDPTGRKGTITNSFYYIPDILDFDNVQKGYYKKKTTKVDDKDVDASLPGTITSCDNRKVPTFIDGRETIWTKENGHAQLVGIKDIEGAMVIHIYYNTGTSYQNTNHDIGTVAQFKSGMTSSNYVFSYKIHFYEKENERPDYNVIRIVKGSDLIEYIDSLATNDYTVPNKTVIAVLNNIEVSPLLLKKFSLSPEAMMVGLYHEIWDWVEREVEGEEVEKFEKVKENKIAIIDFSEGNMDHALIGCNDGVISNITFRRLSIVVADQLGSFAPIMQNNGKINGLQLGYVSDDPADPADKIGIKVSAPLTMTVGGLINVNDGYVYNTKLNSLNIQSLNYYVTFIIKNNSGLAKLNNLKCPSVSSTSRQYFGDKAYNG